MSFSIIDRRINSKGKSTDNRRRFIKRVKDQLREAIKDVINNGSVEDIIDSSGKKVKIPTKNLNQPEFTHQPNSGVSERVVPGNKHFNKGDLIPRPRKSFSKGGGKTAGKGDGSSKDDFYFHLSKDEFLEFFFEDLELPDLVKKNITKTTETENRRAGFSVNGIPARLNTVRTLKQAKGRKFGLTSTKRKKIKELINELVALRSYLRSTKVSNDDNLIIETFHQIRQIKITIDKLQHQINIVPFIDDVDLRYNRWEQMPIPMTQAVMFNIMDVSASMGSWEKEMAKRFFMLMYLFLVKNYERVDIVWIRHHDTAQEVNEHEFFYSTDTGGTYVASSLDLANEIINKRYPTQLWNIFFCQASDGDIFDEDIVDTSELMRTKILPLTQYYAYVEIKRDVSASMPSQLWKTYEPIKKDFHNIEMSIIDDVTNIYPVFRRLFEKRV